MLKEYKMGKKRLKRFVAALSFGGFFLLAAGLMCTTVDKTEPAPANMNRVQKIINPAFKVRFTDFCGYNNCKACHKVIAEEFEKQQPFHFNALASLEDAGETGNPECLKCHSTAFSADGKYPMEEPSESAEYRFGHTADMIDDAEFAGVSCEACHGPYCGTYRKVEDIKPRCMRCHDDKAIPHEHEAFVWEKAREKTKHSFVGQTRTDVKFIRLPEKYRVDTSEFLGIYACGSCHRPHLQAYNANQSLHAKAFENLPEDKRKDPNCVRCHVTGFRAADGTYPMETGEFQKNRKFGFSLNAGDDSNALYQGVQCEACHGAQCGFTRDPETIKSRCMQCHNGTCPNDVGAFAWETDYPKVKHMPDANAPAEETITLDWHVSLATALEEAKKLNKPIFMYFVIPES
jgi:hypothetical protein